MEGRTKQFDGLTGLTLTPPPLFYDRSTPLDLETKI